MEERRKFKVFLIEVQKEKRIQEKEELKNMKREAEVWKYINKKRRRSSEVRTTLGRRRYFMELLEGRELDESQIVGGKK